MFLKVLGSFAKHLIIVLLICALGLSAAIASKHLLVKKLLIGGLEKKLGLKIHYDDLDVALLAGHIRIEGLTIENPAGFEKRELAQVPLLQIICNPIEFIRTRKLIVYLMDLTIDNITIIKNADGAVNLKEIKLAEGFQAKAIAKSFLVEIFKFTLRDVYYIDYTHLTSNGQPLIKRYRVNIADLAYGNLDSFDDIVHLIELKILSQTGIGKVIGMTIAPLSEGLSDVVIVSGKSVKDVMGGVWGVLGLPMKMFKHHNSQ